MELGQQSAFMTDISTWLVQHHLEKYAEVFVAHEITADILASLTESDIDRLNLPTGARRRLIVAIRALTPPTYPPQPIPSNSRIADAQTGTIRDSDRRQLTVLFCDLVGSTELTHQLDPEQMRDLMQDYYKSCREVVARYDGHIAQYWGDGLMVYFGWPSAQEGDAERCVRAALELVGAVNSISATPTLSVRIGVATGTVVVGQPTADEGAQTELAVGETPNMASRLQGLARPNEVVIASSTRQLLGEIFELIDLGERSLKGIVRNVRAWQVRDVRKTLGRFDSIHAGEILTPIVGRKNEITSLLNLWEKACRGEGQVILVSGEPGIGKSRLARKIREQIGDGKHAVIRYQCSQYHLDSSLHPVTEQFEYAAGFGRDDTPGQKLDKLAAIILGDQDERAEAINLIGALFSLPSSSFDRTEFSPQKQKDRTLKVLIAQLKRRCEQKPILVIFEDAQWIDPTSQELVDALIPQIKDIPVLMIVTFRPEYSPGWANESHISKLPLNRLERSEVTQLVSNVTAGKRLPHELLEKIVARTDGVPLFVEELTKSVLESGLLTEAGEQYSLQNPELPLEIPVSLRESLLARLDRLSPVKSIIEIGACIGREFSFDLLVRVSSLHISELEEGLRVLTSAGLIYSRGATRHPVYAFKHALIQDAAYETLLKSTRQMLHARIAQVLERNFPDRIAVEPELLARHYTDAGLLSAAIPRWREAGQLCLKRVALQEAVSHLQRGLALIAQLNASPERDELELSIREPLNAAWTGLRGWAATEVTENAQSILRLAERQGRAPLLRLGLWAIWVNTVTQGRIADSMEWVNRLLSESEKAKDIDLEIFGHCAGMISNFCLGNLLKAKDHGNRVLALYDPNQAERWMQITAHDLRTLVGVWSSQWTWMLGYPDQAVHQSDERDSYARQLDHAFNLGFSLSLGAYVFDYRCEPGELLERISEADRLEQKHSVPFVNRVMVRQTEGLARLRNGEFAEAISLLQGALNYWNKLGGQSRVPYLKSALAEALAHSGDLDAAVTLIEECLAQIERPGWQERSHLAEVLRLKGWMLMQQGKHDAAETALCAAIDWARQQQAKSWELRASTTLAELLAGRGQRDAARALLEPIYNWFTEGFDTHDLKAARSLLDSLRG